MLDDLLSLAVAASLVLIVVFATAIMDGYRYAGCLQDHPEWGYEVCQKIRDGQVWVGMTEEQARMSRGRPTKINRSGGVGGPTSQWVYRSSGDTDYLYFRAGYLRSWSL